MTKWGIVATIKAPTKDILRFVAYHLDRGAHRIYIYLDAPNSAAFDALKSHSKTRVTLCDQAYWDKSGGRPSKHQVRQTRNATHAYRRHTDVDWLIHMDVDEFLWPDTLVASKLGALSIDTLCARIRPIEAIAGDGTLFKAFIPPGPNRTKLVREIYPNFGDYVKGGFLSHVAGKLFVRTGKGKVTFKIHNVFIDDEMNPGQTELTSIALCHCHAKSWENWIASYRYRLDKGSYRAELSASASGVTLHDLFHQLEADSGEAGLRSFYDEICADSPKLRTALETKGLLRHCDLGLNEKLKKHFTAF